MGAGVDPTQGTGSNVYVNYANIAQPIDQQLGFGSYGTHRNPVVDGIYDSGWKRVTVNFMPSDDDWVCLGSNPERTGLPDDKYFEAPARYGCRSSVSKFFAGGPKIDTGIIVLYNGTTPPTTQPTGEVHIRRIKFETASLRAN